MTSGMVKVDHILQRRWKLSTFEKKAGINSISQFSSNDNDLQIK